MEVTLTGIVATLQRFIDTIVEPQILLAHAIKRVECRVQEFGDISFWFLAKPFPDGICFQKGDVILAVNGVKVQTTHDLQRAVGGRHNYWKLTIGRGGEIVTTVLGG